MINETTKSYSFTTKQRVQVNILIGHSVFTITRQSNYCL
jgi:hypothetical protein